MNKVNGEWSKSEGTAGGRIIPRGFTYGGFTHNPQYLIEIKEPGN